MLKLVVCLLFALFSFCLAADPDSSTRLTLIFETDDKFKTDTLQCDPVGGTHPNATAACNLLKSVNGHIDKIPNLDRYCRPSKYYAHVTIQGTYEDQNINFYKRYLNGCYAYVDLAVLVEHFLDYK